MALQQSTNSKANVKKSTVNDIPFSPLQPVLSSYIGVSTAGQTVIALSFSVAASNTDALFLFVDGKKLTIGTGNDFALTSIDVNGFSSTITLNQSLVAGLNIQAFKLGLKKESEFLIDNRFTQLAEAQDKGFQAFVGTQNNLLTATTSTGTPAAGTFYSSIANRQALTDLSQDLKARMGIDRLVIQRISSLATEFGPNGEIIWGAVNDTIGQIRFGGTWTINAFVAGGGAFTATVGDFVEITFYGTGLNWLDQVDSAVRNQSYSVDGVGNVSVAQTGSGVLNSRGYPMNVVHPIVSGLTLGVHTVKITNNTAIAFSVFGFEIVNESTNVKVNPGTAYAQGKKYSTTQQAAFAYGAPVTGTKGGRVLVYQNADGSIGQSFTPTNASQLTLASTNHANEEVARVFNFREFGASRGDDFSLLSTSNVISVGYTLDDGTTALMGASVSAPLSGGADAGVVCSLSGSYFSITFVGTGIDFIGNTNSATADVHSISIDGTSIGNLPQPGNTNVQRFQIASGLPYGTHTVRFTRTVSPVVAWPIKQFVIYQPKKPTLPAGSIALADYNVLANFSSIGSASQDTVSTGVLRKTIYREWTYLGGSWSVVASNGNMSGTLAQATANGDSASLTFFGTGCEVRFASSSVTASFTIAVDGSTLLSGFTTSSYGAGITSFTASTGTVVLSTTSVSGNGVRISGLTLGVHTVKLTKTSAGGTIFPEALDIITPIHSYRVNSPVESQNTLAIGSQGINDNRNTGPVAALTATKAWAQAIGFTSNPTTTSTSLVPIPDMSLAITTGNGAIEIDYGAVVVNNTASAAVTIAVAVDGVFVSTFKTYQAYAVNANGTINDHTIVPVSAGTHKIDLYWEVTAGTGTMQGTQRNLTVREI